MTVTNYKSPGTVAQEATGDGEAWSDLDNVKTSNDVYTTNVVNKNVNTDILRVTNYSMGIPSGATINGIEVQIERRQGYDDSSGIDGLVYLRKTSGQVGGNYADATNWNSTEVSITYGGSTDLWGTTWTESEINSSDFGLDFGVYNDSEFETLYVDHIRIRIYYTAAAGGEIRLIKIAGTFVDKPILTKVAGSFVDKPIKIKVGGTFQDA